MLSRRAFLASAAAAATLGVVALPPPRAAYAAAGYALRPAPARLPLIPGQRDTAVWAYDGQLPGPVLRLAQGQRLRVALQNGLPQDTTVHWHGIRLPHAMDGVPGLTQPPVRPGESFVYDFACEDAGTFWYHPHAGSPEQIGRGLSGLLIVDEPAPPAVDRDVAWVLGDLRLDREAQITADFRQPMDLSHAGRLGNSPLLNGRLADSFALRAGERLRLRLVNTANARIFTLRFGGHAPWLWALDGHPLAAPRQLAGDAVLSLGPGMRADLILDAAAEPGSRHAVTDTDLRGAAGRLLDLVYESTPPLRSAAPPPPAPGRPNPVAEPDLNRATRLQLDLGGGAMGRLAGLTVDGMQMGLREAFQQHRVAWALNGQAMADHAGHDHAGHAPLFSLRLGQSYVIDIMNETAWPHPVHLHGHTFRQLDLPGRPWGDTVLVPARGRTGIALVADNPGDWMLHCHILEHQAAGMAGIVRVG